MIRKQLLIGILAAMTVALPAVGIYAGSAEASEIQSSNEDTVSGNKGASIDKAVTLQNSVKMTDQISAAVNGENIMFSPTSLNFALAFRSMHRSTIIIRTTKRACSCTPTAC